MTEIDSLPSAKVGENDIPDEGVGENDKEEHTHERSGANESAYHSDGQVLHDTLEVEWRYGHMEVQLHENEHVTKMLIYMYTIFIKHS